METEIKLAFEDITSAYERLSSAFTEADKNKDTRAYALQDAKNRLGECMSHVNGLMASLSTDTVSDETVQVKAVKKSDRGN
jgi:hypothetical protein